METADRSELLALLGVERDAEIARRFGLSRERVRQLRVEHGICRAPKGVRVVPSWEVVAMPLLGTMPDYSVGEVVGRSAVMVQKLRTRLGIKPYGQRGRRFPGLSEVTDWNRTNVEIARELGCHYNTVLLYRKKMGKPASPYFRRGKG